jgi:hypothetical protein
LKHRCQTTARSNQQQVQEPMEMDQVQGVRQIQQIPMKMHRLRVKLQHVHAAQQKSRERRLPQRRRPLWLRLRSSQEEHAKANH